MKKNLAFVFSLLCMGLMPLLAQQRYLDPLFESSEIGVQKNVVYGNNISIEFVPTGLATDLKMDVYSPPATDEVTDRPLILLIHTGSFKRPFLNGGISGEIEDSSMVTMAKEFARRGYVTAAVDYRVEWNALSDDPEIRKGTLLTAYYRSIQDMRACVRYFRKTQAEDGNPYGIDGSKVSLVGQGTGGYIVYGAAGVDETEELYLDEIINPTTGEGYIDVATLGNIWGTDDTSMGNPNWVGYESEIQFGMNMGGACGTVNWFDAETTPPLIGLHVPNDPYAPYECDGTVIVPTTGEPVIVVDGTKCAIMRCNELGVNDPLNCQFNDPYSLKAIEASTDAENPDGIPNLFPLRRSVQESGPWEFWDQSYWEQFTCVGASSPDITMNDCALATNPDMSEGKAKAYIDTCINFFLPRAMVVLELPGFEQFVCTSAVENGLELNFTMFPIPASEVLNLRFMDADIVMNEIRIYDMTGKLMAIKSNLHHQTISIPVAGLASGMYILEMNTNDGQLRKQFTVE